MATYLLLYEIEWFMLFLWMFFFAIGYLSKQKSMKLFSATMGIFIGLVYLNSFTLWIGLLTLFGSVAFFFIELFDKEGLEEG